MGVMHILVELEKWDCVTWLQTNNMASTYTPVKHNNAQIALDDTYIFEEGNLREKNL